MKKDIILEKFLESIEILKKIRETNVYINKEIDKFLASLSEEPTPPPPPEPEKSEEKKPGGLEEALKKSVPPTTTLGSKPVTAINSAEAFGEFLKEVHKLETMKFAKTLGKIGVAKTTGGGSGTTSIGEPMMADVPYEASDETPAERPFEDNGEDVGVGARRAKKEKDGRLHSKSTAGSTITTAGYSGPF